MTPPTDPTPTQLVTMLCIAVAALAGVVAFLFRYYSKRLDAHGKEREAWAKEREVWLETRAKEREAWATERERMERFQLELRAEYEAKYRETTSTLYSAAREHETTSRREYADNMETVASKQAEAFDKVTQVIDKIYDYLIRPRRRTD
jgi:exonuclease VII large subunit